MKRTPLRRYTPLASGSPLQRYSPLPPVNRERLDRLRAVQFGPQAALCRTLPCCVCGRVPTEDDPTQAAHVRSRGAGGDDRQCVPLCVCCHRQQESLGTRRAEERWAAGHYRWNHYGEQVWVPARRVHLADVARKLERLAYPEGA